MVETIAVEVKSGDLKLAKNIAELIRASLRGAGIEVPGEPLILSKSPTHHTVTLFTTVILDGRK